MLSLIPLYRILSKTASEEEAQEAIESLELYVKEIKEEHATKEDIAHLREDFHLLLQQMDKRFEQVEKRFEQVEKRFEQVEKRFEQIDKRLEQVDKRFEEMDKRFGLMIDQMNKRFHSLQWMIGIGFTVISLLIGLFGFLRG
ncbi:hypothetical protein BREVNS_1999 [Brevinematales bacterium NS]|nr:hypothetical protein BREVNS_1999 [Brevinematales bacterium NS]